MALTRARVDGFKSEYIISRRRRTFTGYTSMLIKLGTCAAAFCIVLMVAAVQNAEQEAVYSSAGMSVEPAEDDESLGKLQFVEMPGIIEVFGAGSKLRIGFEYTHTSTMDAGSVLCVFGGQDMEAVPSPVNGTVKRVTHDAGAYYTVCVSTDDDMQFVYSGFSDTGLEEGQSVLSGDTLGTCGGYAITIQVYENGRPIEPAAVFDVEGSV